MFSELWMENINQSDAPEMVGVITLIIEGCSTVLSDSNYQFMWMDVGTN